MVRKRGKLPLIDARSLGADCDSCSLDGSTPVPATVPDHGAVPRVTVLLDAPGDIEHIVGKAAQGRDGVWLNRVWRGLNVPREQAAVRNATMCKPGEKAAEGTLRAAVEACRPRLSRELSVGSAAGSTNGRHLVLVCGGKALQAVSGKTNIDDWRGFPVEPNALRARERGAEQLGQDEMSVSTEVLLQRAHLQSTVFFPTYHPYFVSRKPQYEHIFRRDLRLAWDYANGNVEAFRWPALYLDNGDESCRFLYDICERLEAGEQIDIGVDVETKGDWTTRLLLVGIATVGGSCSLLYPFSDEHLDAYARFILAHPRATLVVQNGNHDRLSLELAGFRLGNKWFDTIVAGRIAYPDLPHDLGFLATLFFFLDRWKSEFHAGSSNDAKGGEGWDKYMVESRIASFLRYNAKDALSQVLMKKPLEKRLAYVPK